MWRLHALAPILFLVGFAATKAYGSEIINLGAVLPLTGKYEVEGLYYRRGYEMAIEESFFKVQIKGKDVPVILNISDSQSSQNLTKSLTKAFLEQHDNAFLLGTYGDESYSLAQVQIVEEFESLLVSGSSRSYLNSSRAFSLLSPVYELGLTTMKLLNDLSQEGKVSEKVKIVLLWEDTSHGKQYRDAVVGFTETNSDDFAIVYESKFLPGLPAAEVTTLFDDLNAKGLLEGNDGANVLLVDVSHGDDFVTIHNTLTQYDHHFDFISYGEKGADKSDIQRLSLPETAINLVAGTFWSPGINNSLSFQWITSWREREADLWIQDLDEKDDEDPSKIFALPEEQLDPTWYAAIGYESAKLLLKGIEDADSFDKDTIQLSIESIIVEGCILPGGKVTLNEKRMRTNAYALTQNRDIEVKITLYPDSAKTSESFATMKPFSVERPECTSSDYDFIISDCNHENEKYVEFFWLDRNGERCPVSGNSQEPCWCQQSITLLPNSYYQSCRSREYVMDLVKKSLVLIVVFLFFLFIIKFIILQK